MIRFEEMKKEFGAVKFDGKEYALTQKAHVDWDDEDIYDIYFTAKGIDQEENEYMIRWEIKDSHTYTFWEDGIGACDWDKPSKIKLI